MRTRSADHAPHLVIVTQTGGFLLSARDAQPQPSPSIACPIQRVQEVPLPTSTRPAPRPTMRQQDGDVMLQRAPTGRRLLDVPSSPDAGPGASRSWACGGSVVDWGSVGGAEGGAEDVKRARRERRLDGPGAKDGPCWGVMGVAKVGARRARRS